MCVAVYPWRFLDLEAVASSMNIFCFLLNICKLLAFTACSGWVPQLNVTWSTLFWKSVSFDGFPVLLVLKDTMCDPCSPFPYHSFYRCLFLGWRVLSLLRCSWGRDWSCFLLFSFLLLLFSFCIIWIGRVVSRGTKVHMRCRCKSGETEICEAMTFSSFSLSLFGLLYFLQWYVIG